MKKFKAKLNQRTWNFEVKTDKSDSEEDIYQKAEDKLLREIQCNNEAVETIFFEEIEIEEDKQKLCECGCGNEANVKHTDLYDTSVEYFLCKNCETDFVNTNLSPDQFDSLIENGHTTKEFMLHDDFYDEDGNALQPKRLLE